MESEEAGLDLPYAFAGSLGDASDRIDSVMQEALHRNCPVADAPALLAAASFALWHAKTVILGLCDERVALDSPQGPARPSPKVTSRAAPVTAGAGKHRHDYSEGDVCACGKARGAGGRPKKDAAPVATVDGVTKTDPPSVPLPLVGDVAADKFAGGGLGSSGVRR